MRRLPPFKTTIAPRSTAAASPARRGGLDRMAVGVALVLLAAYKVLISPFFAGCCRFEPSCADYCSQALREHGIRRGLRLAFRRLASCHPFGRHGFDPVPRA